VRAGLSFTEILLGILILSLALVPLIGVSMQTTKGIDISLDEIEATNVAGAVLEGLQSAPWELLTEQYGSPGVELEALPEDLQSALHLPPLPEGYQVWVNILHSEVPPLRGESGLPADAQEQIRELREVRLLEVRCAFVTRALAERVSATRTREIAVSTIVSKASRL
jgi:hypothetical protein